MTEKEKERENEEREMLIYRFANVCLWLTAKVRCPRSFSGKIYFAYLKLVVGSISRLWINTDWLKCSHVVFKVG
jgi:hypothetical protein